jgi:hypothetical protein
LVRARLGARLAVWLLDVVRAARDARELVWSPLLSVSELRRQELPLQR